MILTILSMLLCLVGAGFLIARIVLRAQGRLGSGHLSKEQLDERSRLRRIRREAYLDSLPSVSFYHLVVIFTFASVLGLVLETLWWLVTQGSLQHRYGMVWGPFSPLYGIGAVLLTVCLWKIRKRPLWVIFLLSMVIGSVLEQLVGMCLEHVFGMVSWTYETYPDAITKFVCLRMSLLWGMLGCVWAHSIMPETVFLLGTPEEPARTIIVVALTAFLVADASMTIAVSLRKGARDEGIPATNALERFIDQHYDDAFMQERFENIEYTTLPEPHEPGLPAKSTSASVRD